MLSPGNSGYEERTLGLNYCNGSSFPGALPPFVAKGMSLGLKCTEIKGVNERLGEELVERLKLDLDSDLTDKSISSDEKQAEEKKTDWFNFKKVSDKKVAGMGRGREVAAVPVAKSYGLMNIFAMDYFQEPKGSVGEVLNRLIIEANFKPGDH